VFESLLTIAEKFNKPVSIHSRKSLDDVFEIMTSYNTKHALLHWFDGSKKQLQKSMDMGFFVSYGPVMIYANDKQTLLSKTDESQILVETDGPVRFSRCFDMKSGQISFIPSVIFCASKILGKSFNEMASLLESNSNSFLGI
jgi:TatD DNase family protein